MTQKIRRLFRKLFCIPVAAVSIAATGANDTIRVWDLESCIQYALDNNISIKKSILTYESSLIDTKTAKAALFPSLSFSSSHNLINRPYDPSATNIVDTGSGYTTSTSNSKTSYNGSYSLSGSMTLFNGRRRLNTIEQQKVSNQIAELGIAETENSIIESITQLYIQLLYAAESIRINQSTVELSKAQVDRAKELLDIGLLAISDYAQLDAQYSSDKYQLITAETTFKEYKLQLKQLLELDEEDDIEIAIPEMDATDVLAPLPDKMDVYYTALAFRPEIRSSQLDIDVAILARRIAKASYFPTLSLNAGMGTNTGSGSEFNFGSQLKNNWSNTVGVSISVPIFNNRQTKSAVEKARLEIFNSELNYIEQEKNLFRTIETLWLDASSSQERYIAALESLKSSQISYEVTNEQFNLGLRNTIELLTEKNNLLAAQQATVQAKYMAILNIQLLRFYQDGIIEI